HTPTLPPPPLSLHDALPISRQPLKVSIGKPAQRGTEDCHQGNPVVRIGRRPQEVHDVYDFLPLIEMLLTFGQARNGVASQSFQIDRKSTRLNSSHQIISYAV